MNAQDIIDIQTARRCMRYQLMKCEKKDCLNKRCPLNRFWDDVEERKEKGK